MAAATYRIHKAAELTGVSVELIRAWERRYGVLSPERTPGGYRVYSEEDVALLKRLKGLVAQGMSIGEASRLVPRLREEIAQQARSSSADNPLVRWRRALVAGAEAMDQAAVAATLDEALAAINLATVFDEVLAPALREVGERWHAGTLSVAQEHLCSQAVRARLFSLLYGSGVGEGLRHAVLAGMPEEVHELGLLGAGVRLRQSGWRVTLLGPQLPAAELALALRRLTPQLVGFSAVMDPGPLQVREVLHAARQAAPQAEVWLGGSGARAHLRLCRELGAHAFTAPEDWPAFLG